MACGSKELDLPLSRFPRGKAGAGGFPPRRSTLRASQKRWHASCAGSPHKRAAAPLCIPRLRLGVYRPWAARRGMIQDLNKRTGAPFTQNTRHYQSSQRGHF